MKIFARYECAVTEIELRESEGLPFSKNGYDIGCDRVKANTSGLRPR
jgi:hypothetical protein